MTLLVPYNRRNVASSTIFIHLIHQVIHIRYFSGSTHSFIQKRFPDEVAKGPSSLSCNISHEVHMARHNFLLLIMLCPAKKIVRTLRYFSQTAMIAVLSINILENQAVLLT